jgi:CheY-like chemotaxis protein
MFENEQVGVRQAGDGLEAKQADIRIEKEVGPFKPQRSTRPALLEWLTGIRLRGSSAHNRRIILQQDGQSPQRNPARRDTLDTSSAFGVSVSWQCGLDDRAAGWLAENVMEAPKGKILIIDDDADFRASVTAALESDGYRVLNAASAQEGLAKIVGEPPDLIVLDVIMEYDSAGYEVNQAIKFRDEYLAERNIPILMVSSIQVDPGTLYGRAAEVLTITPDAYMTKPLNFPAFLDQVRGLLAAHRKQVSASVHPPAS